MSSNKSKFGFLAKNLQSQSDAFDEEAPTPEPNHLVEEPPPSPALLSVPSTEPTSKPKANPRPPVPAAPRRIGRPSGKRSDSEHVQVTAYIRKETHLDVKASLLRDDKGRDFSELVEELLSKWLKSRT